ncbi:hypothetical protein EV368DRAFT_66266 [Lentinula lateritia]|nr:hypothetical protein EV368DRAFT_66266 [Lentinula lateritia]
MSNFRDLVPYPVLQVFTQKFFASRSLPLEAQISFPTASQFILVQFFATRAVTQRLGLATVQELLRCDAYVAVLDLSPISAELVSDDASQNSRVLYIETDVTQEDRVESAVARVVEWTKSTGAHLGGVINGAGIAVAELTINRRGEPHSTRTWDRVLGINLTGTFYLTRLVAKHLVTVPREYELEEIASEREEEGMMMKESDGERGVIVMIASTVAYEGQAGQIAYAASKGAIRSMTLPMARDMSRYGVRVVTIAPGPFKTPMTGQFSQSMTDRLEKEAVLFPKRYGMPEEFAATVRWILECPIARPWPAVPVPGGAPTCFLMLIDQTLAAPPWLAPIAAQLIHLTTTVDNLSDNYNNLNNAVNNNYNNLINAVNNNYNNLINAVNNLSNTVTNLEATVNARSIGLERSMAILQNSTKADGLVTPYTTF